jgi:esterase/lipase
MITMALVSMTILLGLLFLLPGAKLNPRSILSTVPPDLSLTDLKRWLEDQEAMVANIITGAEARIRFACSEQPEKTPYVFLHIHGFSACRQETAPVAEKIADNFKGNLVEVRLAGHGLSENPMRSSAEEWLKTVVNGYDMASQLGHKIIIIGTSTGATLAAWAAATQQEETAQTQALLLMSPNFKVKSRFGFLLTLPMAETWIPWLLGRERHWQPENAMVAKYWSSRYPVQAIIEMQKVVDWFRKQPLDSYHTPLALMYMRNDPTIDPSAAVRAFRLWGTHSKQLIPVTIAGDQAEHVFAGNISATDRTAWCVSQFSEFLRPLMDHT